MSEIYPEHTDKLQATDLQPDLLPINISMSPAREKDSSEGREVVALFRKEALNARGSSGLPSVIRVQSPHMNIAAWVAGLTVFSLVTLCAFGRLTQIVTAPGTLVPTEGSLKIYSPHSGVLLHTTVKEGQHVKKGQTLFTVSDERFNVNNTAMLERASQMIRAHLSEIKDSEGLAKQASQEQSRLLEEQIRLSQEQITLIGKSIDVANSAVMRDQGIVSRKANLRAADIVIINELERAEELLTTDQSRLLSLMNTRQTSQRQLSQLTSELAQAPVKLAIKIAQAEQQVSQSEVELVRNEVSREINVEAPIDGVIETDVAFDGQSVTTDIPLMVINPEGSKLVAQIFVPSSGIGFISVGSAVSVKYDAYPFQTFGYSTGHVYSIGKVALLPSEMEKLQINSSAKDSVFNIIAVLDKQQIDVYGRQAALLAGSTLSANLSGETRFIWQWIFNPLLSVKGNAFSGFGY